MTHPNLNEEKMLWKRGIRRVAGLDEAGRGPLAGPVVAGAVVLDFKFKDKKLLDSVNDSKKLSAKKRGELYELIIKNKNIKWGVGMVSEKIIDRINIKNAAELAMERAVRQIQNSKVKIEYLLIDGNQLNNKYLKNIGHKLIVKGDAKVLSVAVASILAKVTRDKIMQKYHKKYPEYRFDLHKGYGTKLHCAALKECGACKIHRQSFWPVRACVKK